METNLINSEKVSPKYFPSISRISRNMCITEKLDGTNGVIEIFDSSDPFSPGLDEGAYCYNDFNIRVLSRNTVLHPEKTKDNAGFCRWVHGNFNEIIKLGFGSHAGEWWGQGIQRNYGLKEKRFSLFAVHRWIRPDMEEFVLGAEDRKPAPKCCHVVPMLFTGAFNTDTIDNVLDRLEKHGSYAAPGFMKPEGIIIYHEAAKVLFKKTIEKDEGKTF